jgi:hypothetical protein
LGKSGTVLFVRRSLRSHPLALLQVGLSGGRSGSRLTVRSCFGLLDAVLA